MTDRELLELAAKAAGVEGEYNEHYVPYGDQVVGGIGEHQWNPLEDNGAAFSLAVKLRMTVYFFSWGAQASGYAEAIEMRDNGDPCKAARRAITECAAEIERNA